MNTETRPTSTRNPILWGAYLACSWTWCIGMFLPMILIRDMGWPGFLIFAIPNVLGATAMGWVLKSKASSECFVETHSTAIWWFSAITVAFHIFWIVWIINFVQTAFVIPNRILMGCFVIALAFNFIIRWIADRKRTPHIAFALLVFSLCVLIATFFTTDAQEANRALFSTPNLSISPLRMLPIMLIGFLLCPYLDITFHHARQQLDTKRNGRLGFTIGFIGFFSFMILLTTRYAGAVFNALEGTSPAVIATPWLAAGLLIHILCQWVFTVRVHLCRLHSLPVTRSKQPILLPLCFIAIALGFLAIHLPSFIGFSGGEIIYRLFMSAYGLFFPGYLILHFALKKCRNMQ